MQQNSETDYKKIFDDSINCDEDIQNVDILSIESLSYYYEKFKKNLENIQIIDNKVTLLEHLTKQEVNTKEVKEDVEKIRKKN